MSALGFNGSSFTAMTTGLEKNQSKPAAAPLAANYNMPAAQVATFLGRAPSGGAANVTIDLVQPGTLYGDRVNQLDLRLSKDFVLDASRKEKSPKITTAIDAFNVANRVNYSGYIGNLSSPFFGRAIASRPARRLQLSMRFAF